MASTALAFLFGWQSLRALFPLLSFLLRDRLGWGIPGVAALALVLFLASFAAPVLRRWWGPRRLLALAAGGLALARLGLQIWRWEPFGELVLALAAGIAFLVFLAARLLDARAAGGEGTSAFAAGCWLGLTVDTALHGAYGTWDMSWTADAFAVVLIAVLAAAQGLLLRAELVAAPPGCTDAGGSSSEWLGFGPFLFLQAVALQNVARLATLSGWTPPAAFAWVLASQLSGWVALLAVLALLVFFYYSSFTFRLPFPNVTLLPLAALVMAAAGIAGSRGSLGLAGGTGPVAVPGGLRSLVLAPVLLLLPLAQSFLPRPVRVSSATPWPVRVMSYNVHLGFDPRGQLDPEAIARVIEEQGADVAALQEVARGWYIGGSIDLLEWLSRRLGMSYVYAPTADPLWGNAVLSHLPIVDFATYELPSDGLPIQRGFAAVHIDVGEGPPLEVLATHFHHRPDGGPYRVEQARMMVEYWRRRGRTVLAGDLNAEPGDEAMRILRQAGLVDAFESAGGAPPGYTFHAASPFKRIDYVWTSPDLGAGDFVVSRRQASDHLAVAVTEREGAGRTSLDGPDPAPDLGSRPRQ